jgi:AcrR family transcriptional regulator
VICEKQSALTDFWPIRITSPVARPSRRRKLQERSIATRTALLDAALDSLVELGYAATTTLETARRAGVSRGAQQHHFPSRTELLTAAVERLLERRLAEFRHAFAALDPTRDPLDSVIDLLWQMFQGPAFVAWLELWVAARTDPTLAAAVVAMDRRFDEESRAAFLELVPAAASDEVLADIGRDFAFALMNGIALVGLNPHGARPARDHLDVLKALARQQQLTVTS